MSKRKQVVLQAPLPNCPVPVEERCCSVTIYRVVKSEPAVREIKYDTAEQELEIEYDGELLQEEHAERLIDDLTHRLSERSATCRDRDQRGLRRGCGVCLQQLQRRARELGTKVGCDSHDCSALSLMADDSIELRRGVLRVASPYEHDEDNGGGRRSPWVKRRVRIGGSSEVSGERSGARGVDSGAGTQIGTGAESGNGTHSEPGPAASGLVARFRGLPLEPAAVVLTLLAMIGGAVTERTGPPAMSIAFYLVAYLSGGYFGVRAGLSSLRARKIDIDILMVLAALGAAGVGAPFEGALLLFLFSLSNVLQDYALDRTRSAIKALSKLRPDTAILLENPDDEQGRRVQVDSVQIDSLLQVRPGDRIPLDGVVERGASSVDQSSITGESMPVEKGVGASVLAGTINQDGELVLRVTKTSSESTIAKVINLVEEAREQQAKTERFLDRFEQYYAIGVILATIGAALLPPLVFGMDWSDAVYKAITLMVAASPCALIISTPASILSSIGNGARRGILFKGGVHVEQAAGIKAVAFDKTGTLTEGKPFVADIVTLADWSEDQVLSGAASLESKSEHVLAQAITAAAQTRELSYSAPSEFRSESGVGVRGIVAGRDLRLGSPSLLDSLPDNTVGLEDARIEIARLQRETKTVVVLLDSGERPVRLLGLIALEDRLRDGVRAMIQDLRDNGIKHVVMLTGDNRATAEAIAEQAGIDAVFPELLPENKLDAIRRIEAEFGPTAMVGDGVNDAPALAGARLGIAMGAAGTDVALETADVVLLSDDLEKIPYLIALSRQTRRTLITNISVALGLITMMVIGIYTIGLPLPLAVIGHEGGTVLVSLNGVRLLMFKRDKKKASAT